MHSIIGPVFLGICLCAFMPLCASDLTQAEAQQLITGLDAKPESDRLSAALQVRDHDGPNSLEIKVHLLGDRRWNIRRNIAESLALLPSTRPRLEQVLQDAKRPIARAMAVGLLGGLFSAPGATQSATDWQALSPVCALVMRDKDADVRLALAELAANSTSAALPDAATRGGKALTEALTLLLNDTDMRVRLATGAALARWSAHPQAANLLLNVLPGSSEEQVQRGVRDLVAAGFPTDRLMQGFAKLAGEAPQPDARILGILALSELGAYASAPGGSATQANAAVEQLLAALGKNQGAKFGEVRAAIADGLGLLAPTEAAVVTRCETALLPLVGSEPWWGTRAAAAWALMRLGSTKVIAEVIAQMNKDQGDLLLDQLAPYIGQRFAKPAEWKTWLAGPGATFVGKRMFSADSETTLEIYRQSDRTRGVVFLVSREILADSNLRDIALPDGQLVQRSTATTTQLQLWRMIRQLEPGTTFSIIAQQTSNAGLWLASPVRASWRNKARAKDAIARGVPTPVSSILPSGLLTALTQPDAASICWFVPPLISFQFEVDPPKILDLIADANFGRRDSARIHTFVMWFDKASKHYHPETEKLAGDIAAAHNGGMMVLK